MSSRRCRSRASSALSDACLISDHALVRYLERVRGLDLDPLRTEINAVSGAVVKDYMIIRYLEQCGVDTERLRDSLLGALPPVVRAISSGKIKVYARNVKLIINGGVVVSVVPLKRGSARARV